MDRLTRVTPKPPIIVYIPVQAGELKVRKLLGGRWALSAYNERTHMKYHPERDLAVQSTFWATRRRQSVSCWRRRYCLSHLMMLYRLLLGREKKNLLVGGGLGYLARGFTMRHHFHPPFIHTIPGFHTIPRIKLVN